MKLVIAQQNFLLGDLQGNFQKIANIYIKYQDEVDLIIFPELSLTSYPPEDLLLSQAFLEQNNQIKKQLYVLTKNHRAAILYGDIFLENDVLYNAAIYIKDGKAAKIIKKCFLPNYGVFDELRYFAPNQELTTVNIAGEECLVLICEDLWHKDLLAIIEKKQPKLDKIIILNASPFAVDKFTRRYDLVKNLATKLESEVIYVNLVGGQDSLVFDGKSFIVDRKGQLVTLLKSFSEDVKLIDDQKITKIISYQDNKLADIYNALILSMRDYVYKNNFKSVLIGLSGGIDSALCAVLASDALGVENVYLVKMPSRYTSKQSFTDADNLINALGCKNILDLNIENIYNSFLTELETSFNNCQPDLTEENLQARIRGVLLMALSNKFSHLVLATSNKSESAVGYATLYGDMCGAFSPLKDIYKTLVYQLVKWRNNNVSLISFANNLNLVSSSLINKAPTAELRDNQKDSDNLPEYDILDQILAYLIEGRKSVSEIIELGFDRKEVEKINKLLLRSEYKRRQSALGPKISQLSFDRERRMPITNLYSNV